jgi:hypothetical protein
MRTGRAKARRNAQYDLEHPTQRRERSRKYDQSAAGRATHKKYYTSERGRRVGRNYKRYYRWMIKHEPCHN